MTKQEREQKQEREFNIRELVEYSMLKNSVFTELLGMQASQWSRFKSGKLGTTLERIKLLEEFFENYQK